MSASDVLALLRLLATKGPPSVSGKAARALANPDGAQRVVNELAAEVLGMDPAPAFTDDERARLVAAIVPAAPVSDDYDKGPFDATIPRVRCRKDQLDAFTKAMADAGFTDVAKFIRWRLFA